MNYKQAVYARRTATADGLPCLKVNCIRWHYKKNVEYCTSSSNLMFLAILNIKKTEVKHDYLIQNFLSGDICSNFHFIRKEFMVLINTCAVS
jgi:hypothetical protein